MAARPSAIPPRATRQNGQADRSIAMLADWHALSNETQLALAPAALHRAAQTITNQAVLLAEEIETGTLNGMGGADALRLLVAVVRGATEDPFAVAGRC
jgi:hypothetical protein